MSTLGAHGARGAVTGPGTGLVLAADGGARDLHGAERLLARLGGALASLTGGTSVAATWASTHLVPGAGVVLAATWDPAEDLPPDRAAALLAADADLDGVSLTSTAAVAALEEHRRRSSGRLVVFPGSAALEGLGRSTTVREVLAVSAIDAVEALAGTPVGPDSVLDLRGHVRPTWSPRGCVLLVQRAAAGLVPFEAREQRPCCTAH